MSLLSREARARYARQISLPEIGEQGQLRLSQTRVQCESAVTAMYLERAGVEVASGPGTGPVFDVQAGDPALAEAAAFLSGALGAVEAIKTALGIGTPLELPESLRLSEEHSS
jgi:hypothetical protein